MFITKVIVYNKSRCSADRAAYNKQRNYCVFLVEKPNKDYFANLHHRRIVDNMCFWKCKKLLFSDKSLTSNKVTLIENDIILENNDAIAEVLNIFLLM